MIGFFLPGDSLLFTAGALAGLGKLDVNIYLLAAIFFVAAVLGNSTGYFIGKNIGRRLFRKKDSKLFKKEYLEKAEKFYAKFGAKAIIFAQFIPIVRTFNPVITGIGKMHFVKFISYNIIGAIFWTIGITFLGYFGFKLFGSFIPPESIDKYLLPLIVLIVLISISPAIIHLLRNKDRRQAILSKVRRKPKSSPSVKDKK